MDNAGEQEQIETGKTWLARLEAAAKTIARELLVTVAPALLLALLITHFVGERTVVLSQSMEPTLHPDQQIIVEKMTYHFRAPRRGEIVVIGVEESDIPYIKRVVGLPGETLEIRNSRVFIDGHILTETYLPNVTPGTYGPVIIPEDHIFVMGDNRGNSRDSRALGPIALDKVIARAWISVWPVEDFGPLK
ncbi:MAG: signal peptidase I [Anaerolineae bacterium]|nr:signal peptidase I [Anaerolineae bacterium]